MRVTFGAPPSIDAIALAGGKLTGYTEANRLQQASYIFVGGILATPGVAQPAPVAVPPVNVGIAYRSVDGLHIAQTRRDGLSLSRLRPYTDWDPVFDEMWRTWIAYRDVLGPERVKRVSTRYINQIELRFGFCDLRLGRAALPERGAFECATGLARRALGVRMHAGQSVHQDVPALCRRSQPMRPCDANRDARHIVTPRSRRCIVAALAPRSCLGLRDRGAFGRPFRFRRRRAYNFLHASRGQSSRFEVRHHWRRSEGAEIAKFQWRPVLQSLGAGDVAYLAPVLRLEDPLPDLVC